MTGRYKAYPEYKNTAIDWLGNVPSHWTVARLKNALRIKNGRDYKDVEVSTDGYPVYGSGGIFKRSSHYLYDGESVLFGRKGTVDKPLLVNGKFWTVDTMFYSEIAPRMDARFIHNQAMLFPYNLLSTNTALPSMTQEDLLELGFVYPSFEEQQKIANFLDHETAKIDTLIAKQEKLIELLKEKRQAVISHAVTKGLNPDAPMKDSGVEWLGEVPEHWDIYRSKRLFPESKNRAPISDMQLSATQDYGVISQKKFMQLAGRKVVQLNSNQELRKKVHVGDFVISMRSFQGGLERAWEEGGIRSSYVVLKPSELINKDYFQYLFKSVRYIQAIQSTANFIRDGQDMNYQNFILIDLPLPSLKEQKYIASFLREHINQIDSLIEKAQKAISLMQERKTALISAAVTGKIDVRHFVAEQGQPQGVQG